MSEKGRLQLLDLILKIWDDEQIELPDSEVGDTVALIYSDWMNMERKNWEKPLFDHLAGYSQEVCEWVGLDDASESGAIVKESIRKDSIVKENKLENNSKELWKQELSIVANKFLDKDWEVTEFGNKEINWALEFLKKAIGIDDFKESKPVQRQFWNHIVKLRDKIGNDDLKIRIVGIVSDNFKRKNCNSIQYLYRELKSYIHEDAGMIPKAPKLDSSGRNIDRMEEIANYNFT
jgi:hypothetical protein